MPVRCVPLTATRCRLRLTWSREHALWTPQQWSCVMFSEESRFSLQSDSRRTLIWRVPGTRYHQENTNERHRYGGAGWLAFGEELFLGPEVTCMFRIRVPSIGGYHPYGSVSILTPDSKSIEHVWDMLGRRIAARQPPPTCLPELRRALLDEWCNIPQDQIDNLILSMPRRCKACIASSGRHTPY
ncbi:HTH_Tnp_Tc3_2 domain-containing protein [Trichonephila clavipes]|nr:HTH_Tnp_Tc3_2 domain-containing protein [Trichonephila clavipes]